MCLAGIGSSGGPKSCPAGFYCPPGTPRSEKYPCLPGTYSPKEENSIPENCTDCDAGFYCTGTCLGY